MSATIREAYVMTDEPLLPLAKAIKQVTGTSPHTSTAIRWITKGVRVGDRRVHLESKRVGARHFVTKSAVRVFVEATTEGLNQIQLMISTKPILRSEGQRRKAIEQANAKLDELGI